MAVACCELGEAKAQIAREVGSLIRPQLKLQPMLPNVPCAPISGGGSGTTKKRRTYGEGQKARRKEKGSGSKRKETRRLAAARVHLHTTLEETLEANESRRQAFERRVQRVRAPRRQGELSRRGAGSDSADTGSTR